MRNKPCEMTFDPNGAARVRLNRPESHNALNPELLESLSEFLQEIDRSPEIRSVELSSTGKHFCSGMDLKWLETFRNCAEKPLSDDFYRLGRVLYQLYKLSKPSIVLVQGAAYGGGAGLVCCCDIALGVSDARFCFSEVRLGLIPSLISPFVIQAIGERAARRYFLSGETIDASEAQRLGLVHEVCDRTQLSEKALQLHHALKRSAPGAITRIKNVLTTGDRMSLSEATLEQTVDWLEETRNSDEAREGISAFLEKRDPSWME